MSESIPKNREIDFIQLPLLLIVFLMVVFVCNSIKNLILTKVVVRATLNIQSSIFHRALHLTTTYYSTRSAGSTALTLLSLQAMAQQLAKGQANAVFSIIIAFFSVFMMLYYMPIVSLIVISVLFIYFIFLITFSILRLKIYNKSMRLFQSTTGYLYQLLKGIAKIKSTASENNVITKWFKRYVVMERVMYKVQAMSVLEAVFKSGINLTLMVLVFLCINFVTKTHATLGDYIGFSVAYGQFFVGISAMAEMVNSFAMNASTFQTMKPFFAAEPELNLQVDLKKIQLTGAIQASHLSYKYPNTSQPVLSNISFNIKPGQFVAFVGESGSGKSTLLKLLLGFTSPSTGVLFYDGYPINQINLRSLRKQFGVVLQSARLLNGSIRENIISANYELPDDELWRIAEAACIAKDIEKMPMGMQTIVSSSDNLLSQGQIQRVLIARALASKPKILFFDEATSALDALNQEKIMKNIERLGITRVVIAHRLSTVINADNIIVFSKGSVVEQGDFNNLVNNKSYFFELAKNEIEFLEM